LKGTFSAKSIPNVSKRQRDLSGFSLLQGDPFASLRIDSAEKVPLKGTFSAKSIPNVSKRQRDLSGFSLLRGDPSLRSG